MKILEFELLTSEKKLIAFRLKMFSSFFIIIIKPITSRINPFFCKNRLFFKSMSIKINIKIVYFNETDDYKAENYIEISFWWNNTTATRLVGTTILTPTKTMY